MDGTYELHVQGMDNTGNTAGDIDYTISFEVINKAMVSNVMNYPNPFTSQTRFVFTLTGSEVPEYFKIQIMTVTGKVVREIMRSELGDLHIGNNITEFAWDGTDQFGDPLANGLYVYRVVTTIKWRINRKIRYRH
jgi:flagellar hook assembly protein FlgD